jgi:hypothetical protein
MRSRPPTRSARLSPAHSGALTLSTPSIHRAALAAAGLLLAAAQAHAIEYAQVDTSESATTAVVVHALGSGSAERPAALLSATYASWSNGHAAAAGYTYRWALAGDAHRWVVGAGVGLNEFRSRDPYNPQHATRLSARAQSEWFGPTLGGDYYVLLQGSSFRGSWLATAQYAPTGWPVAFELSRYHERGYQATNAGLRIATGVPKWFVRIGNNRSEGQSQPYIGIAYNGF